MSVYPTAGEKQAIRDQRGLRRSRRIREREAMTPAQIEDAMVREILAAARQGRPITVADFLRANLPYSEVLARFDACFARAEAQEPRVRSMMSTETL